MDIALFHGGDKEQNLVFWHWYYIGSMYDYLALHYITNTGQILGLRPPNEGRHYFVTTSLNGWL